MPIYSANRAIVAVVPDLALSPSPSLSGILDDIEKQLGEVRLQTFLVNIMQHTAKSFILHLAKPEQVKEILAQGLSFRGHPLKLSAAKPTTTVTLERVPYGLPKDSLLSVLRQYGEVKECRAVQHKGVGLSKFLFEVILKSSIPSRIQIQGNPVNIFYPGQPRSCFACGNSGHEAKSCPQRRKRPRTSATTSSSTPVSFAQAVTASTDGTAPAPSGESTTASTTAPSVAPAKSPAAPADDSTSSAQTSSESMEVTLPDPADSSSVSDPPSVLQSTEDASDLLPPSDAGKICPPSKGAGLAGSNLPPSQLADPSSTDLVTSGAPVDPAEDPPTNGAPPKGAPADQAPLGDFGVAPDPSSTDPPAVTPPKSVSTHVAPLDLVDDSSMDDSSTRDQSPPPASNTFKVPVDLLKQPAPSLKTSRTSRSRSPRDTSTGKKKSLKAHSKKSSSSKKDPTPYPKVTTSKSQPDPLPFDPTRRQRTNPRPVFGSNRFDVLSQDSDDDDQAH